MRDAWDDEWRKGGDSLYGLFRNGEVVGGAGLHRRVGPNALEIGYWTHPDHTRHGYATEVAATLTTSAFTLPEVDRVEIHHDQANTASAGIPRKLGFHLVRTVDQDVRSRGEVGVEWQWEMLRTMWNPPSHHGNSPPE